MSELALAVRHYPFVPSFLGALLRRLRDWIRPPTSQEGKIIIALLEANEFDVEKGRISYSQALTYTFSRGDFTLQLDNTEHPFRWAELNGAPINKFFNEREVKKKVLEFARDNFSSQKMQIRADLLAVLENPLTDPPSAL